MPPPSGWPKCSIAEAEKRLTAPGQLLETEHRMVDGHLYKVYKNVPDSLRDYWLQSKAHASKTYLIFEDEQVDYNAAHAEAENIARKLYHDHGVRLGDRVGIVARNLPEWVTFWWGCQLIGAIVCAVNAWLPAEPLVFCLSNTNCKVVLADEERLKRLEPHYSTLAGQGLQLLLVTRARSKHTLATNFQEWQKGVHQTPLPRITIKPDDPCAIYFTSGTTGLPKGVLQTNRQFVSNSFNTLVGGFRASIRRGEPIASFDPSAPQRGLLLATPLFHVTANHSLLMQMTAFGGKVALMYKWDVQEAVRLIRKHKLTVAGGVPSMVAQLVHSDLSKEENTLANCLFGGAPCSQNLVGEAAEAFPNVVMSQAYGLTETNSVTISMAGEEYQTHPASCGLPVPVNQVMIMDPDTEVEKPIGQAGEIWLRGVNVASGYWNDPQATAKAFTKDHWFKTGDVGYVDKEGFVYISDRIKDIIIRGGENIPSGMVEAAIYHDPRIMDAAVVGVPDPKLGEMVAAVVSPKPAYVGQIKEEEVIATAKKHLPHFAYPVLVLVLDTPIPRNANGKIVKRALKPQVVEAWAARQSGRAKL